MRRIGWQIRLLGLVVGGFLLAVGVSTQRANQVVSIPAGREEVSFWHFWGGRELDVVREIVARFNASQSRYWVRETAMPGNNLRAKLFLSAAGGKPPDLLNIDDPVVADWFEIGLIQPVDRILDTAEAEALSDWMLPAARNLSRADDRLVGICNGLDIRALYYNRTILNRLGIREPKTLEELTEVCRKIEVQTEFPTPIQFAFLPNPQRILFFGHLFGGEFWDHANGRPSLNHSRNIAALSWMQSFARRYGADRLAAHRQSEQSLPGKTFSLLPADPASIAGRFAFVLDGQWRTRDIASYVQRAEQLGLPCPEFGLIPMPPPMGIAPGGGWANGNVFVFPRRAKQSRGAVEFARFWIGYGSPDEAAMICQKGGWIPVSESVINQPKFQEFLLREPIFAEFVKLAANPNQVPTPGVRGAGYLVRVVEEVSERVAWDPRLDPKQELDRANDEVTRQLKTRSSGERNQ